MKKKQFRKLKKHVNKVLNEIKHENFNFQHYCESSTNSDVPYINDLNICGTTFCLAGGLYARYLLKKDLVISKWKINAQCRDYCNIKYGLSSSQSNLLFEPDHEYYITTPTGEVKKHTAAGDCTLDEFKKYIKELFENEDFINDKISC
jgi:hypothetical protein